MFQIEERKTGPAPQAGFYGDGTGFYDGGFYGNGSISFHPPEPPVEGMNLAFNRLLFNRMGGETDGTDG